MVKAIIFDLDNVLVDADQWHFDALNNALAANGELPISRIEHITIYKGNPTKVKLAILSERKGLSKKLWNKINQDKQAYTEEAIKQACAPVQEKIEMLKMLGTKYRLAVCSNAIRSTVKLMLDNSGLTKYIEFYLSNEDVHQPKPSPEIYQTAMKKLGLRHHECVIVEDSDVGKRSAAESGAFLCAVNGFDDVNYYKVLASIYEAEKINVIIPAAGQGKRFSEAGYLFPKPFIDVEGRPMIYHVLDNFKNVGYKYILMQRSHIHKYSAHDILRHHCPDLDIIEVDGLTEGAACTVLLAKPYIDNNNELILANSDQYVDTDIMAFVADMRDRDADAGILTFKSDDAKWSYAKIGFEGYVTEVVEKKVISDQATVGIYYYRHGWEFVKYTELMIHKNIRTNNEFYVCPVFNEFIADGKKICTYEIPEYNMYGLGTPEDLKEFVKNG